MEPFGHNGDRERNGRVVLRRSSEPHGFAVGSAREREHGEFDGRLGVHHPVVPHPRLCEGVALVAGESRGAVPVS